MIKKYSDARGTSIQYLHAEYRCGRDDAVVHVKDLYGPPTGFVPGVPAWIIR